MDKRKFFGIFNSNKKIKTTYDDHNDPNTDTEIAQDTGSIQINPVVSLSDSKCNLGTLKSGPSQPILKVCINIY